MIAIYGVNFLQNIYQNFQNFIKNSTFPLHISFVYLHYCVLANKSQFHLVVYKLNNLVYVYFIKLLLLLLLSKHLR